MNPTPFKAIPINGNDFWIPSDLELAVPEGKTADLRQRCALVYIPWRETYLNLVDSAYRDFFSTVLPYLHVRTTDVHVAICLPLIKPMMEDIGEPVDARVIYVAFILHDAGWSQLSDAEIADSLGVTGVALSGKAVTPKVKHALLGQEIAQSILSTYSFQPELTDAQKELVDQAILYHDRPEELARDGRIPTSIKIVCDVDHLWTFTHENFWQDTIRKMVAPEQYAQNLLHDLNGYFITSQGKKKALDMLNKRQLEVAAWTRWKTQMGAMHS